MASLLLLCQISIMTSHPVVNEAEGEEKQDVFYRENDLKQAISSVIRDENALQRNASSSDRRNGTLDTSLSLLTGHARMVRSPSPYCIASRGFFFCGNHKVKTVTCGRTSLTCTGNRAGLLCEPIWSFISCNGGTKRFVSACRCS